MFTALLAGPALTVTVTVLATGVGVGVGVGVVVVPPPQPAKKIAPIATARILPSEAAPGRIVLTPVS
jgi:hypothetical protein